MKAHEKYDNCLPINPDMAPREKVRQVTVDRYVDYNCMLVVNKIVRSKSATRRLDERNYYKKLVTDKRSDEEREFHNKTWVRAKQVMGRMIALREECQKQLIEFRKLQAVF